MKTTLDIHDALLIQAKKHAKRVGKPLRAIVEDGLRAVLTKGRNKPKYELEDRSVGDPSGENPLDKLSWEELRDLIYEDR